MEDFFYEVDKELLNTKVDNNAYNELFEDIPEEALNYLNGFSFESLSLDDNKSENNHEVEDVQNSSSTLQKDNNIENVIGSTTDKTIFADSSNKLIGLKHLCRNDSSIVNDEDKRKHFIEKCKYSKKVCICPKTKVYIQKIKQKTRNLNIPKRVT